MTTTAVDHAARYREEGFWGDISLFDMFAATCKRVPHRIAVIDAPNRADIFEGAPRRLNYDEMLQECDRYARALHSLGIGKGSVIASQLPNIAEMVILYLAVARIGAVLSPIPTAYRANEIRNLCQVIDFDAYVSVSHLKSRPYYEEHLDALPHTVLKLGLGSGLPQGVTALDTVPPQNLKLPDGGPAADDLFAICWTSGTEGRPKAVPKTHNNMMASSFGAWRLLDLPDGANVLAAFPFVNAAALGGLMMCWMRTGGALVLHHPFDIAVYLEQLASEHIDYTLVAPTLLVYLKEHSGDPRLRKSLHRMRALGTGSAPADPEHYVFFQEHFDIAVLNFFGSNEGAQLCSSYDRVPDPRLRAAFFPRDGDIGWDEGRGLRTANGGSFKLVDRQTGLLIHEPGAIGEMYLRGPAMMPGYLTRHGLDRSGFDADGFFASGDLFEICQDPRLIRFHARARDLIVRGGMKISPAELDALLSGYPGVREAAVAPFADPGMGEKVCAFMAMNDGAKIDLAAVTEYLERLGVARFKWPEKLVVCDRLPRTPLAKLDRKALARRLQEEGASNGS